MNREEQLDFINKEYPLYTNHISKRRIRHDFFKNIQTELQAYLLGFYTADGSIDEKRKTLRVHLSNKDIEIVYLYKDIISPDARLFSIEAGTSNNQIRDYAIVDNGSTGVDITSTILVQDLVNLGIGYAKTYKDWKFPNIPQELLKDFVRGFIDGDGSISGYIAREANKKDRFRIQLQVDAKQESVIDNLISYFQLNEIKTNKVYLKRDSMWRLATSSRKEMKAIFDLLYKDSNFYLTRKFDKFNQYVNIEMDQLLMIHCNA